MRVFSTGTRDPSGWQADARPILPVLVPASAPVPAATVVLPVAGALVEFSPAAGSGAGSGVGVFPEEPVYNSNSLRCLGLVGVCVCVCARARVHLCVCMYVCVCTFTCVHVCLSTSFSV